nr:hypothetical protein [uncultured Pedobacter sp.]
MVSAGGWAVNNLVKVVARMWIFEVGVNQVKKINVPGLQREIVFLL